MAAATPLLSGPVPFKDVVDDGTAPEQEHNPMEELDDVMAALPRRQQPIGEALLYQGFWLPNNWLPGTIMVQNHFSPRPDDVILASYPKCGTTWLKALAFAVAARNSHPPTSAEHPLRRLNPHHCITSIEMIFARGVEAKFDALPSPRLMSSHLPYTLLPDRVTTASECRIVYICRDPKDIVVSTWHFLRRVNPEVSFAETFHPICEGTLTFGPVWDHILSYWRASVARPDKVLFLKYEDLLRDTGANVRRLAEFMWQPFSAQEEAAGDVAAIVELCSIGKMKEMEANKPGSGGTVGKFAFPNDSFFRKGVAGDWANHMTPEMAAQLDGIVREKFRGTGLDFP